MYSWLLLPGHEEKFARILNLLVTLLYESWVLAPSKYLTMSSSALQTSISFSRWTFVSRTVGPGESSQTRGCHGLRRNRDNMFDAQREKSEPTRKMAYTMLFSAYFHFFCSLRSKTHSSRQNVLQPQDKEDGIGKEDYI